MCYVRGCNLPGCLLLAVPQRDLWLCVVVVDVAGWPSLPLCVQAAYVALQHLGHYYHPASFQVPRLQVQYLPDPHPQPVVEKQTIHLFKHQLPLN